MDGIARLLLLLNGDSAGAMAAIETTRGGLDSLDKKASGFGGTFAQSLGSAGKVVAGFGLGVLAATAVVGGASIEMAQQFQAAGADVQNAAQLTDAQLAELKQGFLDTAGTSVYSATQLSQSYGQVAGQLRMLKGENLTTAEAVDFMRHAEELGEATNTDLGTSTQALSDVMRAFRIPLKDAGDTTNILYNTSRITGQGLAEMSGQIDKMHARLGPLAPSLKDTTAFMVDLNQHGLTDARSLMLAVNTSMNTLTGGSKATGAEIHALGLHVFDAKGNFVGMGSIIDQLHPKLAKLSEANRLAAEKELFGAGAGRELDAVLMAGTKGWDASAQAIQRSGSASDAAANRNKTLDNQMKIMKASVTDAGISLGTALIPTITALAEKVLPLITRFSDFASHNQGLITTIFGLVAAFGALSVGIGAAAMIFGPLVGVIGKVVGLFMSSAVETEAEGVAADSAAAQTQTLVAAISELNATMARLAPAATEASASELEVGAAADEAAGQAEGAAAVQERGALRTAAAWAGSAARSVASFAVTAAGAVASAAATTASWVASGVATAASFVATNAVKVASTVASTAVIIGSWIATAAAAVGSAAIVAIAWLAAFWPIILIVAVVIGVGILLMTHWKQVQAVAGVVAHAVGAFFSAMGTAIHNAINGVISWVRSNWPLILAILTGPLGLFVLAVATHWNQIKQFFSDGVNKAKELLGNLVGFIQGLPGKMLAAAQNIGSSIVNGIEQGLRNAWSGLTSTLHSLASNLPGPIKAVLDISSPSGVFDREVGQMVGEGVAVGVEKKHGRVASAVRGLVGVPSAAPAAATGGLLSVGAGAAAASSGPTYVQNIYNPIPEPASDSVRKLRLIGQLGIPG